MKKRILTAILTVTMLVSLACAMTVSAFANDGVDNKVEYYATAGSEVCWSLNESRGFSVISILQTRGDIPGGLHTSIGSDGQLYLFGKPDKAGTYEFDFTVHVENDELGDWDDMIYVTLHVEPEAAEDVTLPTYYATLDAGKYVRIPFDMGCSGHISDSTLRWGNLPDGMSGTGNENSLYIEGTPCKAGVYEFAFAAYNGYDHYWAIQPCRITVIGNSAPVITKQPTGEYVEVGHDTCFVAKADNATKITWLFVSKDSKAVINACDGPSYFRGLIVSGCYDELLDLDNVPMSMDGWYAEAKFEGPGGITYSAPAFIYVCEPEPYRPPELAVPVIRTQPGSAKLNPGETATLSVNAYAPDGNALTYQWYKNDENSNRGGQEIVGATGSSLSVSYEEGTHYYYCVVYNNTRTMTSKGVITSVAFIDGAPQTVITAAPAETSAPAPTVTPAPAPAETPAPAAAEAVPTAAPASSSSGASVTAEQVANRSAEKADHTVAFLVSGVVAVAMICATLLISTGRRRRDSDRDEI